MSKATALVEALKRELRARGITYADLAKRINMSEASVKRMFSHKNFTLVRMDEILQATGIDFRELAGNLEDDPKLISELNLTQEKEIISDPKLFVTAVSALNLIPMEHIVSVYQMSQAEVIKYLLRLDKIGFLELLPNNRVKLLVSHTFRWIPNGPIQTNFRALAAADFLDARFDQEDESMQLINVMLSKQSAGALLARLKQVAREFSQQHQDDSKLPFDERNPISVLLAARPWLPKSFKELVRAEMVENTIARRR